MGNFIVLMLTGVLGGAVGASLTMLVAYCLGHWWYDETDR